MIRRGAGRRAGALGALLVAIAVQVTAGCGGGGGRAKGPSAIGESSSSVKGASDGSTTSPAGAGGRQASVHTGICAADAAATGGDTAAARRAFEDAHQGLHEVADAASKTDRAASARLLEAKEKVEADLASSSTATATLRSDLDALLPALRAAAAATGHPMPDSCG
ncbi:MAG TPA: hypothetical protein VHN98_13040 [Acidimicrobiales bacterium]|nr:hypothetical protein [Acidimicrobiales bacterium]